MKDQSLLQAVFLLAHGLLLMQLHPAIHPLMLQLQRQVRAFQQHRGVQEPVEVAFPQTVSRLPSHLSVVVNG